MSALPGIDEKISPALAIFQKTIGSAGNAGEPIKREPDLIGVLTDLRTFSSGWALGSVQTSDNKQVSVIGDALTSLEIGTNYEFFGSFSNHEKYGLRLKVKNASINTSSDIALINHIVKSYNGVGEVGAKKLIEQYKSEGRLEELREALIYAPTTVDFSSVSNRIVTLNTEGGGYARMIARALSLLMGPIGLGNDSLKELASQLLRKSGSIHDPLEDEDDPNRDRVKEALDLFKKNPYAFVGEVERFSFLRADKVGLTLGIDRNSNERLESLACYALNEACNDYGHSFLTEDEFKAAIAKYDRSIDFFSIASKGFWGVVGERNRNGLIRFYPRAIYDAENGLSKRLASKITTSITPLAGKADSAQISAAIAFAERKIAASKGIEKFTLDDTQRMAVENLLSSSCGLHTITGGPGSGKTALLETVMHALEYLSDNGLTESELIKKARFCAPVGKAAKVMTTRIGQWGVASTIHSMLGYKGVGKGGYIFDKGAAEPITSGLVVIDETSMLDVQLGAGLFDAIEPDAHVIMLGDPAQLTPIAPGAVLHAVLRLPVDHHKLHVTHRNDGELLRVINDLGDGVSHSQDVAGVHFTNELPKPNEENLVALLNEIKTGVTQYGGFSNIGVLCPVRRGNKSTPDWNVTFLNHFLREHLNPGAPAIAGCTYSRGDRIIIKKNMILAGHYDERLDDSEFFVSLDDHDLNPSLVVNGDTGYIASGLVFKNGPVSDLKGLYINLDDGTKAFLHAKDLATLDLAYAITVHAAQGSEYNKVIAFVPDGNANFLHRSMLFTAYSRAKNELHVLGDPNVRTKLTARLAPTRNCVLAPRAAHFAKTKLIEGYVPKKVLYNPTRQSLSTSPSILSILSKLDGSKSDVNSDEPKQRQSSSARMR